MTGAIREVQEEVCISLPPEHGRLVKSVVREEVNGVPFRDILDVWLFEYDGPVVLEQATTQEVAQTAWMAKWEIQRLLDNEKLVQTLGYVFETEGL